MRIQPQFPLLLLTRKLLQEATLVLRRRVARNEEEATKEVSNRLMIVRGGLRMARWRAWVVTGVIYMRERVRLHHAGHGGVLVIVGV